MKDSQNGFQRFRYMGRKLVFGFIKQVARHWVRFGVGAPSGTARELIYINLAACTTTLTAATYENRNGVWVAIVPGSGTGAVPDVYTVTSLSALRSLNGDGTTATLGQVIRVLATLVSDMKAAGLTG